MSFDWRWRWRWHPPGGDLTRKNNMALATGIFHTFTLLVIGAATWIVVKRVGTCAKLKHLTITNKPARADWRRNYRSARKNMALATGGIFQTFTLLEIGAATWIVVIRVGTCAKLKHLANTNKPARADGGSSGDRNLVLERRGTSVPHLSRSNIT